MSWVNSEILNLKSLILLLLKSGIFSRAVQLTILQEVNWLFLIAIFCRIFGWLHIYSMNLSGVF